MGEAIAIPIYDMADDISKWLYAHNIQHFREQRFEGLMGEYDYLRFDLWLPDYRTCIEADGQQHYQACKNKDAEAFLKKREYGRRKEMFCLQNHMRLVRVVYDEIPYLDRTLGFLLTEREQKVSWYTGP